MGIIVAATMMPMVGQAHMNTRDYKQYAPNTVSHIFNRGVGKQNIFHDDEDFSFFLWRLKENIFGKVFDGSLRRTILPSNSFSLLSYCLMPNHYHLLIRQCAEIPLSKLLLHVCTSYSKYYNRKYGRVGGLFQDQFKAVRVVTDEQLVWLSAYIHLNPVTAGLVSAIDMWQWSSWPEYAGLRKGMLTDTRFILDLFSQDKRNDYIAFVQHTAPLIAYRKSIEHLLLD